MRSYFSAREIASVAAFFPFSQHASIVNSPVRESTPVTFVAWWCSGHLAPDAARLATSIAFLPACSVSFRIAFLSHLIVIASPLISTSCRPEAPSRLGRAGSSGLSLRPMTICMGAVCQDGGGAAVVVASDRMVTWASLTEFEHRVPKVRSIGAAAVALIAGDALTGTRMAEEVAAEKAGQALSVEQFADALADRYVAVRMECVEADLLKARGLNLQTFYQMHQQLLPQITGGIDQEMAQYNLGVELLVAGVDVSGGHVFTIHNPGGRHLHHDVIGHAAIGSGWIHAIQSMIGFHHASMQPLLDTIFRVYVSKRRAELAPGVGRETDLMIVTQAGPERLTEDAIAQLSGLYDDLESSAEGALEGKLEGLALDREEAFA